MFLDLNVQPTLHSWDESHLGKIYYPFYILQHFDDDILMMDFAFMFIRNIGQRIFFCLVFVWFRYLGIAGFVQ